jgi:small subunit ribosomal protein S2
MIAREINRLSIRLSGVRLMKNVPNLVFIVDVGREETAVHEANLTQIPVIALVDTNCDPRGVDYVIPSNDDAIRAIKLLVNKIAEAVLEGKASRKDDEMMEMVEPVAAPVVMMPVRSRLDNEDDLQDVDLLGASTLAKLVPAKHEEDVVETPVDETGETA